MVGVGLSFCHTSSQAFKSSALSSRSRQPRFSSNCSTEETPQTIELTSGLLQHPGEGELGETSVAGDLFETGHSLEVPGSQVDG